MVAVDEGVNGEDAVHIDVVVHGNRPFAGPGIIQKPEADFRGCARPVFGRRAVRSPVAQFQVGVGTEELAPGPIAEQDAFRLGARRVVVDDLESLDHGCCSAVSVGFLINSSTASGSR